MSIDSAKIEAIKEKLRKLIAKEASARDIGNQAEADAFAAKISELMLEYELEMDEVMKGSGKEVYEVGDEIFDTEPLSQRHESNWVAILYHNVSEMAFCRAVLYAHKREAAPYRVIIFGDQHNREMLHYIVAQLVVKLRALSRRAFNEYKDSGGQDKRNTYVRSFLKGACLGIRLRLLDERKKQEAENTQVTGLVLDRQGAIQNYMEDKGYAVKPQKHTKTSSGAGYREGVNAGKSVDINKGVSGKGSPTKLLG